MSDERSDIFPRKIERAGSAELADTVMHSTHIELGLFSNRAPNESGQLNNLSIKE